MSQIRLDINEDSMHQGLVAALRERAVDVETVLEAGLASENDDIQLAFATCHGNRSAVRSTPV